MNAHSLESNKQINGVILRKLETLDTTLSDVRSLDEVSVEQLESDWRTRRAIERSLQVMVEIVLDICQRIISVAGQSPASTGTEAVQRCIQLGALSDFRPYRQTIQFRNFIVHRYERVDTAILVDMVNRHLPDFERFRDEILAYVRG
ncbi:MAG: DUF86 domain-containing protein [Anaerolineales bacterium]|jgi:uncharacterized protein YutE (UPF0331/DUF86 family)